MNTNWSITVTLKGTPSEAVLDEIDSALPCDAFVAALPATNQFSVTALKPGPEWEKAASIGCADLLDIVRAHTASEPEVLGVETVEQAEYDRRAEEPTLPEIISTPEVATILGVSRQRVHQLIASNRQFPKPFMRLGSGPVWIAEAVRKFDREWERKPGRPPTSVPSRK